MKIDEPEKNHKFRLGDTVVYPTDKLPANPQISIISALAEAIKIVWRQVELA